VLSNLRRGGQRFRKFLQHYLFSMAILLFSARFICHTGRYRLFREEVVPLCTAGRGRLTLCQGSGMRKGGGYGVLCDGEVSIRDSEVQRSTPLVSVGRSIVPGALGAGRASTRVRAIHETKKSS